MINKFNDATDTQEPSLQETPTENTEREETIREIIKLRDYLEGSACSLYYWSSQHDE